MPYPWEYQRADQRRHRVRVQFETEARKQAFNRLAEYGYIDQGFDPADMPRNSTILEKPTITPQDIDKVISPPKKKSGGGVLGKIGGAIQSGLDAVALNDIDQPWDLLRPAARLLELEQKHVARPLTKQALKSGVITNALGLHYDIEDETPGIIKVGLDTIFSPSTWLGPGAAKLVAKQAPRLGVILPNLRYLSPGTGSRNALIRTLTPNLTGAYGSVVGAELFNQLGFSPQTGALIGGFGGGIAGGAAVGRLGRLPKKEIVAPDLDEPIDTLIGLKTRFKIDDEHGPKPGVSPGNTGPNYVGGNPRGNLLFTRNETSLNIHPQADGTYELSIFRGFAGNYRGRNSAGSDVRGLLEVRDVISDLLINNPNARFTAIPTDARRSKIYQMAGFKPIDEAPPTSAREAHYRQPKLELDRTAWRAAVEATTPRDWKYGSSMIDPSSPEMQSILKREEEALMGLTKKPTRHKQARKLRQDLEDTQAAMDINRRVLEGTATPEDIHKLSLLLARRGGEEVGRMFGPDTLGAAAIGGRNSMVEYLDKLAKLPDDHFGARHPDDVILTAKAQLSATQKLRQFIGEHLSPEVQTWILQHWGVRFTDSPVHYLIDDYMRGVDVWNNNASAAVEQMRHVLKAAYKMDETHILDDGLTSQAVAAGIPLDGGKLRIIDMVRNRDKFTLTPQQQSALWMTDTIIADLREVEYTAGVKSIFTNEFRPVEPQKLYHSQVNRPPVTVNVAGREVEIPGPRRPGVASRFGATQPAQRQDLFPFEAEGVAAGGEYAEFFAAQQARIAQGGKLVMDNWLKNALEPYGKTISELLPETTVKRYNEVTDYLRKAERVRAELVDAMGPGRSGRGAFKQPKWAATTPSTVSSGLPITPEIQHVIDLAESGNVFPLRADRVAAWNAAKAELDDYIKTLKPEHLSLKGEIAGLRKTLGKGTSESPVTFHGKYFGAEMGEELTRRLEPQAPSDISRAVQAINNFIRPAMATLDLSFMGVQGLLVAFNNPKAYMTALLNSFSTEGYKAYFDAAWRDGKVDLFTKSGGYLSARYDFAEFLFPQWMEKVPVVGPASKLSNTLFTRFGNIARLELFDTMAPYYKGTPESLREIADFSNKATGYVVGKPTSIESMATFAPRFFRAQLGLISDSLKTGSVSGAMARQSLRRMVLWGSAMTYLANEALGNETEFDPRSNNFMRIRIAGNDVSLFGPWDSLVRTITTAVTDGPVEASTRFARSKASPVFGRLWDVFDGETWSGHDLDWSSPTGVLSSMAKLGEQSGPISIQNIIDQGNLDPTDPKAMLSAGLNLVGTKTAPLTGYENLIIARDEAAQSKFKKDWDDLEPFQRNEIEQANPELEELEGKAGFSVNMAKRNAISERFALRQEELDQTLPKGKEWVDAYDDLKRERIGAYQQWAEEHPEALARLKNKKPTDANELALHNWYSIFDRAQEESWTPLELSQMINQFEAGISSSQQAYIERNTGLKDSPRVKEYKAALNTLQPYFELEEEVWNNLRGRGAVDFDTFDEYYDSKAQQLLAQGHDIGAVREKLNDLPLVQQFNRAIRELRRRYRRSNPGADAALVEWFGAVPIGSQTRSRASVDASSVLNISR